MNKPQSIEFFYYPRTCALAVHIMLEELALDYQRHLIDLSARENKLSSYLSLNPTGAIPALLIDGKILTETQAILSYLGDLSVYLPRQGEFARYKAHEWMNYLSSTVHVAIRCIFRPQAYVGEDELAAQALSLTAHQNLAKAIDIIEQRLEQTATQYALGEHFTVVDAYLFIMYLWCSDQRINADIRPKHNWNQYAEKLWQRDAVKKAVHIESQHRSFALPNGWTLT